MWDGFKTFVRDLLRSLPVIVLWGFNLFYRLYRKSVQPSSLQGPFLLIVTNGIGDTITALPAIQTIRRHFPGAQIDCLARPFVAPLLQLFGEVDDILTIQKAPFPSSLKTYISNLREIYELRKRKYRTVINLSSNFYSAWIAFLSGARERCGWSRVERIGLITINDFKFLLTQDCRAMDGLSYVEIYLNFVKALGLESLREDSKPAIRIAATNANEVNILLQTKDTNRKIVIIHPLASQYIKIWPAYKYIELINKLTCLDDLLIIVAGDRREEKKLEIIRKAIPLKVPVLSDLNLIQYVALLQKADLFIGNDSGPMHLAYAVGTNSIAIFGPTNPDVILPPNSSVRVVQNKVACSPCYDLGIYDRCPLVHHKCMAELSVKTVYDSVCQTLSLIEERTLKA